MKIKILVIAAALFLVFASSQEKLREINQKIQEISARLSGQQAGQVLHFERHLRFGTADGIGGHRIEQSRPVHGRYPGANRPQAKGGRGPAGQAPLLTGHCQAHSAGPVQNGRIGLCETFHQYRQFRPVFPQLPADRLPDGQSGSRPSRRSAWASKAARRSRPNCRWNSIARPA